MALKRSGRYPIVDASKRLTVAVSPIPNVRLEILAARSRVENHGTDSTAQIGRATIFALNARAPFP